MKPQYKVTVKYTRIAIPDVKSFNSKAKALKYQQDKEQNNPHVRWTRLEAV